jgi:hypothetical protein
MSDTAALLGPRTPLATPHGAVAAGQLRPGDLVLTRDAGPRPVRRILRPDPSGTAAIAPVYLRAPYFGLAADLLVSGAQPIAFRGTDVEYLFGEDEVLAEARHLVDGIRAHVAPGAARLAWLAIDLGTEALLLSGGCALATAALGPAALRPSATPRRISLHEARALQAMRLPSLSLSAA